MFYTLEHTRPLSVKLNIPNQKDININYPVIFEYLDKPEFNGFTFLMPTLKIIQRWDLLDSTIVIDIDITMNNSKIGKININIKYNFINNNQVNILIIGKWIEKSFMIPGRILENIISETKDFITIALNKIE